MYEEYVKLQQEHKGYIVFVLNGIFCIAIGESAKKVSKILGLNTTCIKEGICKCGFPIRSLEKYVRKLKQLEYSFVVYKLKDIENFECKR